MGDKNLEENSSLKHLRYLIADIEVVAAENYLIVGEQQVPLEPKVMDLLVYFIEHQNQVLSRDILMAEVWQGTVVSDSALSWSISQLRKALNDKPSDARFIKTISKKGYQFIADVEVLAKSELAPQSATVLTSQVESEVSSTIRSISPNNRYLWIAALWIIFIAIFTWWFAIGEPKERYRLESGNFVTRLDGLERGGRLSSDGKLMLFRHKNSKTFGRFELMLKPMSENLSFAVTQNDGTLALQKAPSNRVQASFMLHGAGDNHLGFDYKRAIWGEDDYQIIAVRNVFEQNQLARCEIVRLKLAINREQIIGQEVLSGCHYHGLSQISIDRTNKRLFFTDKTDIDSYELYGLDLASNNVVELLKMPLGYVGAGVRFVDYSPHNNQLLVLEDILNNETQFMALAFDENEFKVKTKENLFLIEAVYFSAYWGPKGKDIWYNWGNDRVKAIDVAVLPEVYGNENQPNKRKHPVNVSRNLLVSANGWNYDAHPVNENLAVFNVSDANSSDLTFAFLGVQAKGEGEGDGAGKKQETKFERERTSFSESFGVFAHKSDKLAFVANESGWPQIWEKKWEKENVSTQKATSKQISDASRYRHFRDLAYSDDDNHILAVSRTTLASLDLINQRYRIHYDGELQPTFPRWFPDSKRIVFSAKNDGSWLLYTVEVNDEIQKAEAIGDTTGYVTQPINHHQILFNRHERPGLWLLDINTLAESEFVPGFPQGVFWRKLGKYVYFMAVDKGDKGLYRTILGQYKPQKVLDLPSGSSNYFDIKKHGDGAGVSVLFTDYAQYQSDLKIGEVVGF